MIKTKTEYKEISGTGMAKHLTTLSLDGWQLSCPIWYIPGGGSHALLFREVKVIKDDLYKYILEDFKVEIGTIVCKEYNRLSKLLDSDRVKTFILDSARRYDMDKSFISQILVNNLEQVTWVDEDE